MSNKRKNRNNGTPSRSNVAAVQEKASSHESSATGGPHVRFDGAASEPRKKKPLGRHFLGAQNLEKSYTKGVVKIPVLRGVTLPVHEGEFLSIVGQSGSGKSTLLHLLATLDRPDSGQVVFEGERIDNLPSRRRDRLRNTQFGMIFQFYHLLPEMTTLENVVSPLMIGSSIWNYLRNKKKYTQRARDLLERVGLGHRLHHKPRELSGGEMQRAAIARALVVRPKLLLADEPTGNLDKKSGQEIMDLLCSLNDTENLTIVMVTHDLAIADLADRMVQLVDGKISND